MQTRRLLRTCFAILAACSVAEWARGDYVAVNPKDIEMKVELVGEPPLPFQPVRLRVSIRNVSKNRLGPRLGPVDDCRDALIRGPRDDRYEPAQAGLSFSATTTTSACYTMNRRAPLYLEPGEQTSVSFALGRRRVEVGTGVVPQPRDISLFPEPGEYWLKCSYCKDIEKQLEVRVREPQGADRAIYEVLRKNPQLAAALLEGVRPPEEALVPKLEAIVELFPESSYAGYARFALARFHLKGNGFPLEHPPNVTRVALAKAATQLEQIYPDPRIAGAYYPNAMIAMKAADLRFYEINMIAGRLVDNSRDSVEYLELFAMILGSDEPQDRKLVEVIAGREYPTDNDPTERQRATARYRAEVWTNFRKVVPAATGQKP